MHQLRYVRRPDSGQVAAVAYRLNGVPRADLAAPGYLVAEAMSLIATDGNLTWTLRDGIAAGVYASLRSGRELVLSGERALWLGFALNPRAQGGGRLPAGVHGAAQSQ